MLLRTERLTLETWQSADWAAFRPIATDPEVMRYITGGVAWSDEQIQAFVQRQVKMYAERGFCRWKLVNAGGQLIGFCGVGYWREGLEPEIGWWVARAYWGRGLATEAARCALHDAFERVGFARITSVAAEDNTASRRVMEKLGLTLETGVRGAKGCGW
jgi:ribosomal-protein-alanine N-acetyltransferase